MPREDISTPRGRRELHTADMATEQRPVHADLSDRDGDVILVDPDLATKEYQDALAFNEQPVTIRIEPSSAENAATVMEVWVNGQGAEMLVGGKWRSVTWLPMGDIITVKRKYVEVIARNKVDKITTPPLDTSSINPDNTPRRHTRPVNTFSVIRDDNPKGAAWLSDLLRRNF